MKHTYKLIATLTAILNCSIEEAQILLSKPIIRQIRHKWYIN